MKISILFLIAFSKIVGQRPIIAAGSVLLLLALSVFAEEERNTNVVLIMADDLRLRGLSGATVPGSTGHRTSTGWRKRGCGSTIATRSRSARRAGSRS